MSTDTERRDRHNARLFLALAQGREQRGFVVTGGGRGSKTHAAVSDTLGFEGFRHPRPLCQTSTTTHYHWVLDDQTLDVTCKRCLASLGKRGI